VEFRQHRRLEPRVRPDGHGGGLAEALEAQVADPLFLLARQWQLGEFQGEDGGSPVSAELRVEGAAITRFRPGDDGVPVDLPAGAPLEAVVEAGADAAVPTLRERAAAGLRFLALLDPPDAVADAVRDRCPLLPPDDPHDTAGHALHTVLATRAPDGAALAAELRQGWTPPGAGPGFPAVRDRWLAWSATRHPAPGASSWVTDRLEHRFAVGAAFPDGQVVLSAPAFDGGPVESYHLDHDTAADLGTPVRTKDVSVSALPTRVTYAGMPAERWWEIEDDTVNLPAIGAGPPDLARLLLVSFANAYGNDWWVVPVDLAVGSVHRITALSVVDTFGDSTPVAPTDLEHGDGWCAFRPADAATGRPAPPLLPLLPTAGHLLEGDPVEEVLFARDEMANLGWAVERLVQSAAGGPRRRGDEPFEESAEQSADALTYRLVTPVPPHWVPLVPEPLGDGSPARWLRRGVVRGRTGGAVGRVLEPERRPVRFRDEEVPRTGVRVVRVPVLARGSDGRTVWWMSRRARTGRGEASSRLAFDEALPPAPGT
jgi:hypothetical protein